MKSPTVFDTTALGSVGFISLCAKPHKTHVLKLHLGFMRLCSGL